MNVFIKFSICIFLLSNSISSQNKINVYPIKIGNIFVFTKFEYRAMPYYHDSSYVKSTIISDTIANNVKYFKIINFPPYPINKWYRYDTLTGRLLYFSSQYNCNNYIEEKLADSLWARLNDSTSGCSQNNGKCSDTNYINIFGLNKPSRRFSYGFGGGSHWSSTSKKYSDYFGIILYENMSSGSLGSYILRYRLVGCVIDGILYGDTTNYFIGIQPISSETPTKFSLSQNYPNPFNPITNIEFEIKEKTFTKIIVYDILGIELCNLVNENLGVGKYKVNWDATSYSSGVYIYKLVTDKFVDAKRMLLIK